MVTPSCARRGDSPGPDMLGGGFRAREVPSVLRHLPAQVQGFGYFFGGVNR